MVSPHKSVSKQLQIFQILKNREKNKQIKKQLIEIQVKTAIDSICSFSRQSGVRTDHETTVHPVLSTPATIQLLWNHSCSGPALQLHSVIVRRSEPNPSRPTQPRPALGCGAAGGDVLRSESSRSQTLLPRPVFSAADQHLHLSQQKRNYFKRSVTTGVIVSLLGLQEQFTT